MILVRRGLRDARPTSERRIYWQVGYESSDSRLTVKQSETFLQSKPSDYTIF